MKRHSKFKIGDRILIQKHTVFPKEINGKTGLLVAMEDNNWKIMIPEKGYSAAHNGWVHIHVNPTIDKFRKGRMMIRYESSKREAEYYKDL